MGMVLGLVGVLLTFGAVDALVPLLIVIVLIAAAAGLTRGWNAMKLFGIDFIAGAASLAGTRGSMMKNSAFTGGRTPGRSFGNALNKIVKGSVTLGAIRGIKATQKESLAKSAQEKGNTPLEPNSRGSGQAETKWTGRVKMSMKSAGLAAGQAVVAENLVGKTKAYYGLTKELEKESMVSEKEIRLHKLSKKEIADKEEEARMEAGKQMNVLRNRLGIQGATRIEEVRAAEDIHNSLLSSAATRAVSLQKAGYRVGPEFVESHAARVQSRVQDVANLKTLNGMIKNIHETVGMSAKNKADAITKEIVRYSSREGKYAPDSSAVAALTDKVKNGMSESLEEAAVTASAGGANSIKAASILGSIGAPILSAAETASKSTADRIAKIEQKAKERHEELERLRAKEDVSSWVKIEERVKNAKADFNDARARLAARYTAAPVEAAALILPTAATFGAYYAARVVADYRVRKRVIASNAPINPVGIREEQQ
jgi:hypothetical protein